MKNEKLKNLENAENAENAGMANENNFLPESIYDNLPVPLNTIVSEFEGRERDIVFLSSIGVISSVLPNIFGIYDRRKFHSNLYIFIIAPPASGKGVMNWAKKLAEPIHEKLIKDSKKAMKLYKEDENSIGAKPKLQIKIVPANISASKLYSHMENAHDSLLIFESEADSLSNMLKQDWGNFSDVMRKAFQHETISISRQSEDTYFEIRNPKLSIVLSGTPDQLKPLIASKDNGLFSRFIFYYFDDVIGWKDVSPSAEQPNLEDLFKEASDVIYELYGKLYFRDKNIEVKLTQDQWDRFQDTMNLAVETFILDGKIDFISVIKRLGLIFFRICMILTVLRQNDNVTEDTKELISEDIEVDRAINIIKSLIDHSLKVFDMYNKESIYFPMNERILYNKLSKIFTRAEGVPLAINLGIAERTFADVLKRWQTAKIIKKVKHGEYQKLK